MNFYGFARTIGRNLSIAPSSPMERPNYDHYLMWFELVQKARLIKFDALYPSTGAILHGELRQKSCFGHFSCSSNHCRTRWSNNVLNSSFGRISVAQNTCLWVFRPEFLKYLCVCNVFSRLFSLSVHPEVKAWAYNYCALITGCVFRRIYRRCIRKFRELGNFHAETRVRAARKYTFYSAGNKWIICPNGAKTNRRNIIARDFL